MRKNIYTFEGNAENFNIQFLLFPVINTFVDDQKARTENTIHFQSYARIGVLICGIVNLIFDVIKIEKNQIYRNFC